MYLLMGLSDMFPIKVLINPSIYFKSISLTCFLVSPSNIINVGATAYPFPTEAIPMDPMDAKELIFII